MTLREKQSKFASMVADLIYWISAAGYQLTLGDAYRDKRVLYGHPRSFHRKRLAIDINLFKDGKYLRKTEDHQLFGEYWESRGGSWGGRWGDGNHYSLGEK